MEIDSLLLVLFLECAKLHGLVILGEVTQKTSVFLCACSFACFRCLEQKLFDRSIGKEPIFNPWRRVANLVFCLSSEVSSRLWNLPGSPRDIVHVEQGVDDKKQVPEEKNI